MTPYRLRLIDRVYRWFAVRFYPRSDGGVVLIGPDCFADLDATVVCWQGENYYGSDVGARLEGEAKGLRDAADRLDGEAHRLPVLADFAAKFRDRADRLTNDY